MINAPILLLPLWEWGAGESKDRRIQPSLHQTIVLSNELIHDSPPHPGAGGGEAVRSHESKGYE